MRDLTTNLLSEVCKDLAIEPLLQELTGETLKYKTANRADEARLEISARGFWVKGCRTLVDVRVFNPLANTYSRMDIRASHIKNEKEKIGCTVKEF